MMVLARGLTSSPGRLGFQFRVSFCFATLTAAPEGVTAGVSLRSNSRRP